MLEGQFGVGAITAAQATTVLWIRDAILATNIRVYPGVHTDKGVCMHKIYDTEQHSETCFCNC